MMMKLWQFVISHKVKFSIRLWISCHTKTCLWSSLAVFYTISTPFCFSREEAEGFRKSAQVDR